MAVGNEVWMLENAVYSILASEGYVIILWKNNLRVSEAVGLMKTEAADLLYIGVVDKIIYENESVTIDNIDSVCETLKHQIGLFLEKY